MSEVGVLKQGRKESQLSVLYWAGYHMRQAQLAAWFKGQFSDRSVNGHISEQFVHVKNREKACHLSYLISVKGYPTSSSVLGQTWTMKTSHGISPGSTGQPQRRSQSVYGIHKRRISIMWHLHESECRQSWFTAVSGSSWGQNKRLKPWTRWGWKIQSGSSEALVTADILPSLPHHSKSRFISQSQCVSPCTNT